MAETVKEHLEAARQSLAILEDAYGRSGTSPQTTERHSRLAVAHSLLAIARSLTDLTETIVKAAEPPRWAEPPDDGSTPENPRADGSYGVPKGEPAPGQLADFRHGTNLADLPDGTPIP